MQRCDISVALLYDLSMRLCKSFFFLLSCNGKYIFEEDIN